MTSSSVSMVSMVKPARFSSEPMSRICVKGDMCGEIPPLRSSSASWREERNSKSVSPPNMEAMKTPSGFRLRLILAKQPGKSFTQCRLRLEMTRSREFSSNYKDSLVIIEKQNKQQFTHVQVLLILDQLHHFETGRALRLLQHGGTGVRQRQLLHALRQNVFGEVTTTASYICRRLELPLDVKYAIRQAETHLLLEVVIQSYIFAVKC